MLYLEQTAAQDEGRVPPLPCFGGGIESRKFWTELYHRRGLMELVGYHLLVESEKHKAPP